MKRVLFFVLLAVAACDKPEPPKQEAAKGGPPPIPPYQMRAEAPADAQLASGEALFSNRCGACHLAGGMGTNLLTKQRMMAGQPPETGMLANRTDLSADYVKTVVRMGKMAMPRLTRVDITDAELDSVAAYLGKAGK
jgi:mono/diheme cytochrome c family protein